MAKEFWFWHGLLLIISWFGIAFVAILIKKKFHGLLSNLIHTVLFLVCSLATLFVSIGAMYRTYVNWARYPHWGILNKSHKLAGFNIVTQGLFSPSFWFGRSSEG